MAEKTESLDRLLTDATDTFLPLSAPSLKTHSLSFFERKQEL